MFIVTVNGKDMYKLTARLHALKINYDMISSDKNTNEVEYEIYANSEQQDYIRNFLNKNCTHSWREAA